MDSNKAQARAWADQLRDLSMEVHRLRTAAVLAYMEQGLVAGQEADMAAEAAQDRFFQVYEEIWQELMRRANPVP